MTDPLNPPPHEPLSDQARARIRARLVEATAGEPGTGRRWLMPVAAAAAVVVIAAATGYVALRPSGETAAPAGPGTSGSVEPTPEPTPEPTTVPEGTETEPVLPGSGGQQGGQQSDNCADEVPAQLRGDPLDKAVTFPSPEGEVSFWVGAGQSVLCHESGRGTVHAARPLDPTTPPDVERLRLSTLVLGREQGQFVVAHVAGGQLPDGVTGIEYRFPDGHVEQADTQTDGQGRTWWRMQYTSTDGPLSDPDQNVMKLEKIVAVVTLSGVQTEYPLEWGIHTCAQVNHGC